MAGKQHLHRTAVATPAATGSVDESPFDNCLRTDDYSRAQTMLTSGIAFRETYPPRMTLDQYVCGRSGDDGFSQTLLFLVRKGIYPVTRAFLQHVVRHFSLTNVFELLNAIPDVRRVSPQGAVLHLAVLRGSLTLIKKLVEMGFDLEGKDSKGQTPLFYAIQGQCSFA